MANTPGSHRLPNEMLREIALRAAFDSLDPTVSFPHLCLVCFDWTRTIRPVMWEQTTVSSGNKLRGLIALITMINSSKKQTSSSRLTHITEIITNIWILRDFYPCSPEPPWVHLVYPMLKPFLPRLSSANGTLNLGHDSQQVFFHSFYDGLPRTIPGSFNFISALSLDNVRFSSREALLKAISCLKSLNDLQCNDLKWDTIDLPSVTCALPSALNVVDISSTDSASGDLAGWWLSPLIGHRCPATSRPTRRGANHPPILGESDYHAMEAMVSCLERKLHFAVVRVVRLDPINDITSGSFKSN